MQNRILSSRSRSVPFLFFFFPLLSPALAHFSSSSIDERFFYFVKRVHLLYFPLTCGDEGEMCEHNNEKKRLRGSL